ncbi:hypothetical protein V6N11_017763 [Hibiscus sabdariffa]|uniref:Uncharacterized protein n=1 Tax=Hibiscus sabdariffa TaxID=183260 RepID=A0ABR2TZQ6_9ROSI
MTGYRVNVGEILAKELAAACVNDKGILAFPCLIYALCRRVAVPTSPADKYQAEKMGWTRAVYMRKMDVTDATPLNVAMPTPPTSPIHMPAAATNEAGPSIPAEAPYAPADTRQSPAASPQSCQFPATPPPPAPPLSLLLCQPVEIAHQIHPWAPPQTHHNQHHHLPSLKRQHPSTSYS